MLRASLAISSCTTRARGIIVNYTIACKLKGRKPELKMFLKQLEHPALMEQQMFPIDQYERKWQLISCRFQQRTRHTITKRNRINPEQANKQANKQTNKQNKTKRPDPEAWISNYSRVRYADHKARGNTDFDSYSKKLDMCYI